MVTVQDVHDCFYGEEGGESERMPENAVSILRVSTAKQQREGEGINDQRRGNNAYIHKNHYRLFHEFELAETSDAGKEREEFNDALAFCVKHKKEIQVVVIHRVNRFSRGGLNEYYAFKAILKRHGIRLESATENIDDTPSGEAMEGILAVMARLDNRMRTDTTIGAEKTLTGEGYWCRPAPTGFVNGKKVVGYKDGKPIQKPILLPDPDEKQWSLLCYGLRKQLKGVHSVTKVAHELAKKGFLMRETVKKTKGKRKGEKERVRNLVSPQSWLKICRSPVYGGLRKEKWTGNKIIPAKFNGAITPEEWYTLQKALNKGKEKPTKQRRVKRNPDFPLRQFLRCPKCGERARGYPSRGKCGVTYKYYDCPNPACRFRMEPDEVHRQFLAYLKGVTPKPNLLALFRAIVLDVWEEKYNELNRESIEAGKNVVRLKEEKRNILDLLKKAKDNPALVAALSEDFTRVDNELTDATVEREAKEREEYNAEIVVTYCNHYLEHASELWDISDAEDQFSLQELMFPEGIHHDSLLHKRTPTFSLVYRAIQDIEEAENDVAAPRGIEPRLAD